MSPPDEAKPDPTENVLDLVEAAMQRQDDLREMVAKHAQQMTDLQAHYQTLLRDAETERVNAIRAMDMAAVTRASDVAVAQANTLATQVATSAETLRGQVAAAALAASTALATALDPIQKAIEDLRRAQYEAQGQKAQVGETRLNLGAVLGAVSVLLVIVFGVTSLVITLTK